MTKKLLNLLSSFQTGTNEAHTPKQQSFSTPTGRFSAFAAEAEEILAAIAETVAREAKPGRPKASEKKPGQLIVPISKDEHATKTAHKAAELFNTNRTKKAVGKPAGTILDQNEPRFTADTLAKQHSDPLRA